MWSNKYHSMTRAPTSTFLRCLNVKCVWVGVGGCGWVGVGSGSVPDLRSGFSKGNDNSSSSSSSSRGLKMRCVGEEKARRGWLWRVSSVCPVFFPGFVGFGVVLLGIVCCGGCCCSVVGLDWIGAVSSPLFEFPEELLRTISRRGGHGSLLHPPFLVVLVGEIGRCWLAWLAKQDGPKNWQGFLRPGGQTFYQPAESGPVQVVGGFQ